MVNGKDRKPEENIMVTHENTHSEFNRTKLDPSEEGHIVCCSYGLQCLNQICNI